MLSSHGFTQDFFTVWMIEEIINGCSAWKHISIIQNVQIRRASCGILCRRSIYIRDALHRLLYTIQLTANLITANELNPYRTLCAFFQVVDKLQTAGPFNQKVAFIKASSSKFQCELWAVFKTLFVGRISRCGQFRKGGSILKTGILGNCVFATFYKNIKQLTYAGCQSEIPPNSSRFSV